VFVFYKKLTLMLFIVVEVILYSYCWHFITSWN